ncbi:arcC [Symbiodinium pilosum]|uniref:ArcC protein n=1 Tax=Symbiodinium pilosum TaxID=2952 RepID=A0A812PF91_SYMPI|nr:arcC [Symbiodinium pilosum]
MPVYHSRHNGSNAASVCGCSLVPLKTNRYRGPAPTPASLGLDDEFVDLVDEALRSFRWNILFKNFEVLGDADRVLVYLTLWIQKCLSVASQAGSPEDAARQLEAEEDQVGKMCQLHCGLYLAAGSKPGRRKTAKRQRRPNSCCFAFRAREAGTKGVPEAAPAGGLLSFVRIVQAVQRVDFSCCLNRGPGWLDNRSGPKGPCGLTLVTSILVQGQWCEAPCKVVNPLSQQLGTDEESSVLHRPPLLDCIWAHGLVSGHLASDFDEQLFKPELYELESENDAQAQQLLPYPTWSPEAHREDMRLPGPLGFIQSDWFLVMSGLVVAFNIMCLYIQVACDVTDEDAKVLENVNDTCLILYTIEVILRLFHFRMRFCAHAVDGMWNLFDFVIVCAGIFDRWIFPSLNAAHLGVKSQASSFWLPLLRGVRVLRFIRVVKLVGVLFRSDLRWTESVVFASVVSAVIITSVILMGLETDIQSPLWEPINDLVLLFFLFELAVNIRKQGWLGFFTSEDHIWNWLDMIIVVLGALDQWVIRIFFAAVYGRDQSHELGSSLMLFRLLRMLRILRVLRLVKAVHPLYLLALGIAEAVQSMFWVLLLTMVALYASAIVITRVVRETHEIEDVPAAAKANFQNVPDSMFTLFVLMNGEEWPDVMPLLDACPSLKFMFVLFIIISTWALLSVMTGVVSDNMIYAREAQSQKDETLQGERRSKVQKALNDVFFASRGLSTDKRLAARDWQDVLKVPFYAKKIMDVVPSVPKKDLIDMFDWLEADESDSKVTFQEVLRGVMTLAEPPSGKTLLQVDSEVKQRFSRLQQQGANLEDCIEELDEKVRASFVTMQAMMDELYELSGAPYLAPSALTPDGTYQKTSPDDPQHDPLSGSQTPSEMT